MAITVPTVDDFDDTTVMTVIRKVIDYLVNDLVDGINDNDIVNMYVTVSGTTLTVQLEKGDGTTITRSTVLPSGGSVAVSDVTASLANSTLTISVDGTSGTVDLSPLLEGVETEIQSVTASLNGTTLTINVDGVSGTVDLSSLAGEGGGAAEITSVNASLSGNTLTISVNGVSGNVDLSDIAGSDIEITGAITTVVSNNLEANRVVISTSSGKIEASEITTVELNYLDGVTSNIQTQISTINTSITNLNEEISNIQQTIIGGNDMKVYVTMAYNRESSGNTTYNYYGKLLIACPEDGDGTFTFNVAQDTDSDVSTYSFDITITDGVGSISHSASTALSAWTYLKYVIDAINGDDENATYAMSFKMDNGNMYMVDVLKAFTNY